MAALMFFEKAQRGTEIKFSRSFPDLLANLVKRFVYGVISKYSS